MSNLERVTVNLTPRSAHALSVAADLTDDTKTDVINRAIKVYAYIEQLIADGGSVYVQSSAASEPTLLKFF